MIRLFLNFFYSKYLHKNTQNFVWVVTNKQKTALKSINLKIKNN